MIDAEQYLSCDRLIARSTVAGFRFLPVTVKWKWIFVNTFGSSLARSAFSVTEQPAISWRLFFRIITTSYAVQPPVPSRTISIGRGARLRPPPSGAPSITARWPLPVSAAKDMPSGPIQLTLHSTFGLQRIAAFSRGHCSPVARHPPETVAAGGRLTAAL